MILKFVRPLLIIITFLITFNYKTTSQTRALSLYHNLTQNSGHKIVLVDKNLQEIKLIQENSLHRTEAINSLSIEIIPPGNANNRSTAYDNFPEGIYFSQKNLKVQNFNNDSTIVALLLNYPNPIDSMYNKKDFNLLLQTSQNNISKNKGCIYIQNNFSKVTNFITKNIPIIITSNSDYWTSLSNKKHIKSRKHWSNFFSKWKRSIYSNNFKQFSEFYATLISEKKDLQSIFNKYRQKNILFSSPIIYTTNNQTLIETNLSDSSGKKLGNLLLYLIKIKNRWKIINWNKRTPVNTDKKLILKNFLQDWSQAWENEQISKFISYYDSSFQSKGKNFKEWKNYKISNFKEAENIQVGISDLEIIDKKSNIITLEFLQNYSRKQYEDRGIKTLKIRKDDSNQFKILEEKWRAID